MKKKHTIAAAILANVASGHTLPAAIHAVLGDGPMARLLTEVYAGVGAAALKKAKAS